MRESAASARNNALGALAVVPEPAWEQQAAQLQSAVQADAAGARPVELEQKSRLDEGQGLERPRGRTGPLTQTLASVDDYLAKINEDIATDSAALQHDKMPSAPPRFDLKKQDLEIVPASPPPQPPIPAVTATTSPADRQRILDEKTQRAISKVDSKLKHGPPPAGAAKRNKWASATRSVSADLNAAEDAIDSLESFTRDLPDSAAGYLGRSPAGSISAAVTPPSPDADMPSPPATMAAARSAPSALSGKPRQDDDDLKLDPEAFDGPNPPAFHAYSEHASLRKAQQHALKQSVRDGTRTQLAAAQKRSEEEHRDIVGNPFQAADVLEPAASRHESMVEEGEVQHMFRFAHRLQQDKRQQHEKLQVAETKERAEIKGLRRREAQSRAAFKEHEARQEAQDKKHERHLAHELAQDRKAEKIALERSEMRNEIERVEAHMQNAASARWEAMQEARKRAIIKESDMLAQRKWAKDEKDEKAKEALWQKEQNMKKYLSEGQHHGVERGDQVRDVRQQWQEEEVQGLAKLQETRREAEAALAERIALDRKEERVEAKREEKVLAEKLAERKKRLHLEAHQHQELAAWKASIRKEEAVHTEELKAQEKQDASRAESRLTAIENKDVRQTAKLKAAEHRDMLHGNAVVRAAEKAAEKQAEQKAVMIKEEETFRRKALQEIAEEQKVAVSKTAAKVRLQEKARQQKLAKVDEAAARQAHQEKEQLRSDEIRRRLAWETEHEHAKERERERMHERQEEHLEHEKKLRQRREAERKDEEEEKAKLQREERAHERKEAQRQLTLDEHEVDHEIRVAKERAAAAAEELRARGVVKAGKSGGAFSMSQLIAKTAGSGAPKALASKLARAMHTKVLRDARTTSSSGTSAPAMWASESRLGEGVSTVMIAQEKDTLKDEQLAQRAALKREEADRRVKDFAARERAKEVARHQHWEEQAKLERSRLAREAQAKQAAHQHLLHAAHVRQESESKALRAVEQRDEQELKQLQARQAKLMGAQSGTDATLMNEGARMASLYEGKEKTQQLRKQYAGICFKCAVFSCTLFAWPCICILPASFAGLRGSQTSRVALAKRHKL